MASRHCRCGYTTDDIWVDECPICLKPMALTTRAVPFQATEAPRQRRPRKLYLILLGLALIFVPVGIGIMAISTGVAAPLFLERASSVDSTGRIRAGMSLREAVRELEPEPDLNAEVTLQHLFVPGAKSSGQFIWGNGTRVLRVTFRDWRVWSIEEGTLPFPIGSIVKIDYDKRDRPRHAER